MDEGKAEAEEVCLTGFPLVEASFPCVFLSLSPLSLSSLVSASSCCVPCIVSALTFFVFYSHHHHHPTFAYPTFHHSTFVYVVLSIVLYTPQPMPFQTLVPFQNIGRTLGLRPHSICAGRLCSVNGPGNTIK